MLIEMYLYRRKFEVDSFGGWMKEHYPELDNLDEVEWDEQFDAYTSLLREGKISVSGASVT